MLKKGILNLIGVYFILGNILFPMNNFSAISQVTALYKHCKQTEHSDMTVLDFFTDHLLGIDSFFDSHPLGDSQHPHHPIPTFYSSQTAFNIVLCEMMELKVSVFNLVEEKNRLKEICTYDVFLELITPPPQC